MKSVRRSFLALSFALAAAVPAYAQDEELHEIAAEAADESGHGHETELEHLRIHGIGDIFVIPSDLPDEVREEREHLRTQLIAAFINFGVLIAIILVKVRPKVRESLVARRSTIAKDIEEAARLKAEAEAKHAEYKKRLAALDVELAEIREEMLRAGKADADRIVAEAETKAARTRRETEFLIEQRMKSLREELTKEAVLGAIAAAETVLREKTTAEDQTRLSKSYVSKLGEVSASQSGKAGRA